MLKFVDVFEKIGKCVFFRIDVFLVGKKNIEIGFLFIDPTSKELCFESNGAVPLSISEMKELILEMEKLQDRRI